MTSSTMRIVMIKQRRNGRKQGSANRAVRVVFLAGPSSTARIPEPAVVSLQNDGGGRGLGEGDGEGRVW